MNRFILSEQEKNEILSLHKKYISEQATNTASTVSNTASTQTSTVISPGVYNEKVLELQNLLKTKHGANIAADGKLGPKTLGATENVLQGKPATPNVVSQDKTPSNTSTQTPVLSSSTTPDVIKLDNTQTPNVPDESFGTYDKKTDTVYKPGETPIGDWTQYPKVDLPNFNVVQGEEPK